ncbi:UNVERIFIED_CONTAM: hypothetical protein O8I53_05920 [Campylobacter lari]
MFLKNLDKNSSLYHFLTEEVITGKNLDKTIKNILFNRLMPDIFASAEKIYSKNKRKLLPEFLNAFTKKSMEPIYIVLKEAILNKLNFKQNIKKASEVFLESLEKEQIFKIDKKNLSPIINSVFKNKKFINSLKPLLNSAFSILENLSIYHTFDEIFVYFIKTNAKFIKESINIVAKIIVDEYNSNYDIIAELIIDILNLNENNLNSKE